MSYEKTPWGRAIPYTSPITGKETTLYNIATVAAALGRSAQTVRKWEVGGIIPPTPFKQNGRRLYSKEHIDVLVNSAERAKLKNGIAIAHTNFSKWVYKGFQEVNDMFFKKEESENVEKQ